MDHRYLRPLIRVQLYLPNYTPKGCNLLLTLSRNRECCD